MIRRLRPDVLAKGRQDGETIVGADLVRDYGGSVAELPLYQTSSTGELVKKIRRAPRAGDRRGSGRKR